MYLFYRKYVDPPDTGYSWVVLCCCIMLQLSIGFSVGTVGIFTVEWIEVFQKGEGITSWIGTANQCLLHLVG